MLIMPGLQLSWEYVWFVLSGVGGEWHTFAVVSGRFFSGV